MLDSLLQGYRRFRGGRWPEQRELYEHLADIGQRPATLVIACCDSRVDPSSIFDAGPGQLFIIRNVANLVPPYEQGEGLHGTSAAIEFAVRKLEVSNILVLGHAQCGGVTACLNQEIVEGSEFLEPWLRLMRPARDRCAHADDPQTALERESILLSMERLKSFPFILSAMEEGRIQLSGARFGVADGRLEVFSAQQGRFVPVP